MTISEANVAVVVIVSELEAAVADVHIIGILKLIARAASLIVVDGAEELEGGAVNGLRGRVDMEAVSTSEVTVIESEPRVTFM